MKHSEEMCLNRSFFTGFGSLLAQFGGFSNTTVKTHVSIEQKRDIAPKSTGDTHSV